MSSQLFGRGWRAGMLAVLCGASLTTGCQLLDPIKGPDAKTQAAAKAADKPADKGDAFDRRNEVVPAGLTAPATDSGNAFTGPAASSLPPLPALPATPSRPCRT